MTDQKKISAKILDGKAIAEKINLKVRQEILAEGLAPGLAAILVGNNPASKIYLRLKENTAGKIGVEFSKYLCNDQCYDDIDERELLELIDFLNQDEQINGILLQLPLPDGFDNKKIMSAISPEKDVDGFNGGKVVPPTVAAIKELLLATGENLKNKTALIIGNSKTFMDGIKKHLTEFNFSKITEENDVPKDCDKYDVVIIALGRAGALKAEHLKSEAIVIDVGINKIEDKTVGDADVDVWQKASWVSPVPGGVGPLTVACLMRNLLQLSK